jgi:hypothetical protein
MHIKLLLLLLAVSALVPVFVACATVQTAQPKAPVMGGADAGDPLPTDGTGTTSNH